MARKKLKVEKLIVPENVIYAETVFDALAKTGKLRDKLLMIAIKYGEYSLETKLKLVHKSMKLPEYKNLCIKELLEDD